jgi:AraC-like DNA-binding protein
LVFGKFNHLETIDIPQMVKECKDKWFKQALSQVSESVVRLGIVEGEYHWHIHDNDDEFFFVLEGRLLIDLDKFNERVEKKRTKSYEQYRGILSNISLWLTLSHKIISIKHNIYSTVLSLQVQFPFLDYAGVPFFKLSEPEANKMEQLFYEIDAEIKSNNPDKGQAIRHFIHLILNTAKRSYIRQELNTLYHNSKSSSLVTRFKKMVGQHFITIRTVAEYASTLAVTPKHLSKVIKEETNRTPSDFIDDMLMMEIKALLRHSSLTISEIAYQLDFSDPSHLSTFFKKYQGIAPLQFRNDAI